MHSQYAIGYKGMEDVDKTHIIYYHCLSIINYGGQIYNQPVT